MLIVSFYILGFVATSMKDFFGRREFFRWYSLYVHDETYHAMTSIVEECEKCKTMSLFTTSIGKYVTLEEFEATQNHSIGNVRFFLKDYNNHIPNICFS